MINGAMPVAEEFRCVIVIPSRYGSTRFPGKPLHPIAGRPLVQHVWERCREARRAAGVVIATDDERIAAAARSFGAEAMMTRADHPSGTDRLAEVAAADREATHFVNVQGDEPLIEPALIDRLIDAMCADGSLPMITAASPIENPADADNPNVVKVVVRGDGLALYFSRSRIPHPRRETPVPCRRHLGIYGYRRDILLEFVKWRPTPLEETEGLEQLRALEHGVPIRVIDTRDESPGIDTPEQVAVVEAILTGRG
jgi:3-deoxy-manno-octulosonate cytidylyltransferase (CMP-KDO synthetase)